MAKLTTTDLVTLVNDTSAVATINANNAAIEAAMEKTLSRDGTSPNTMSAELDMNSNFIINSPDPTQDTHLITKGYGDANFGGAASTSAAASAAAALVSENNAATSASNASTSETNAAASAVTAQAAAAGMQWKAQVINATTANITLSGEQTIDGILTSTSRILVKDQTDPAENGIYVTSSGAWSRSDDMNSWDEFPSATIAVEQGSTQADFVYLCTSDSGGVLGTTAVTFNRFGAGSVTSVASGSGLSGGPITTSGTLTLDLTSDQSWTGSQRVTPVTDNDGSFDMSAGQDFIWTPTAADVLEFTNATSGQRGMILLVNPSAYVITFGTGVVKDEDAATELSTAGTYQIAYWCYDGTNIAISYSGALS